MNRSRVVPTARERDDHLHAGAGARAALACLLKDAHAEPYPPGANSAGLPGEPSPPGRLVGKAVKDFEAQFCRSRMERISHATRSRLEDLVAGSQDETGEGADGQDAVSAAGRSHFAELKADPGAPGLESLLAEVNKLQRVRRLELPADLFADVSEKLVDAWRARASKEYPANLERMKPPRRLTLLAALCHVRQTEITDSLVDLFIQLVLKINTRAERKVDKDSTRN